MSISFQPHVIRRDSPVPLRMLAAGWLVGSLVCIVESSVGNRFTSFLGLTFLAGGFVALTIIGNRSIQMLVGAAGGALASWIGYDFAVDERLLTFLPDDPGELTDRTRMGPIIVGLAVLVIGVGAVLEAFRAQAEPGQSPVPVRIALIAVGMAAALVVCTYAGVSGVISALVVVAVGAALTAMAWLRSELPPEEFQPTP